MSRAQSTLTHDSRPSTFSQDFFSTSNFSQLASGSSKRSSRVLVKPSVGSSCNSAKFGTVALFTQRAGRQGLPQQTCFSKTVTSQGRPRKAFLHSRTFFGASGASPAPNVKARLLLMNSHCLRASASFFSNLPYFPSKTSLVSS